MRGVTVTDAKQLAGEAAVKYVKDGQVVGLGTGSTVFWTLKKIGELGLDIVGVCTSVDTERKCAEFGIKTGSINDYEPEVAIDGADEVDPAKHLIKGGGGALTREKIVDYRAKEFVVIVTENKLSEFLGQRFYLPVEVLPFCWKRVASELEGGSYDLARVSKRDFTTDNGNYILDCHGRFHDPKRLEKQLNEIPGIVENGLFTRPARIIAGSENGVREL
jgi:ribose 5-phosphate isomerase A